VRATQFYEFVDAIAASATDGTTVRLPHAAIQPIAAISVTRAAIGRPINGITEIAGPETFGIDDFVRAEDDIEDLATAISPRIAHS
jgi:hypothetical protein